MDRRQLLKAVPGLAVGSLLVSKQGLAGLIKNEPKNINNTQELFNQALKNNPQLIGFNNVEQNFSRSQLSIEGQLPKDLAGTLFRNGPAKHERKTQRYTHLFEGDGMVQQFTFANGKVHHQGRFIDTEKFKKEEHAQAFLYSGPETQIAHSLPVINKNMVNTANTNIIHVGNDLWALWEEGSATSLDPNTLNTNGIVDLGQGTAYENALKGMPFSAHPKQDPNGDIWNFGYNPSGHIILYHLSKRGAVKNVKLINAKFKGGMLHDFLITHKHLLIILPSISREHSQGQFFSSIAFEPKKAMRVLVVSKQTLTVTKEYELPPGFAFHFGNAWEEQDGTIHFDASLYDDVQVLHNLSEVMAGQHKAKEQINNNALNARATFFTLKTNNTVEQHTFSAFSEFPKVHSHLVGLKNRDLFFVSSTKTALWSDTVTRLDTFSGKQDRYFYGDDFLVEEHISVNPKCQLGSGYIIGTALHVPSKRTCVNVFREEHISDGPIARAWLGHHLPLGFHGHFVNSTV